MARVQLLLLALLVTFALAATKGSRLRSLLTASAPDDCVNLPPTNSGPVKFGAFSLECQSGRLWGKPAPRQFKYAPKQDAAGKCTCSWQCTEPRFSHTISKATLESSSFSHCFNSEPEFEWDNECQCHRPFCLNAGSVANAVFKSQCTSGAALGIPSVPAVFAPAETVFERKETGYTCGCNLRCMESNLVLSAAEVEAVKPCLIRQRGFDWRSRCSCVAVVDQAPAADPAPVRTPAPQPVVPASSAASGEWIWCTDKSGKKRKIANLRENCISKFNAIQLSDLHSGFERAKRARLTYDGAESLKECACRYTCANKEGTIFTTPFSKSSLKQSMLVHPKVRDLVKTEMASLGVPVNAGSMQSMFFAVATPDMIWQLTGCEWAGF